MSTGNGVTANWHSTGVRPHAGKSAALATVWLHGFRPAWPSDRISYWAWHGVVQLIQGACLANHVRIFWLVQYHSKGWAYSRLYSGPEANSCSMNSSRLAH